MRGRECFLRVTSSHLFEVELQAAQTLARLELQSLEAAEVEPEPQTERAALEVSGGVRGPGRGAGLPVGSDWDSWVLGARHRVSLPSLSWTLGATQGSCGGQDVAPDSLEG